MQTDRLKNKLNKREKRKKAIPRLVLCLILALAVTGIFFIRSSRYDYILGDLEGYGLLAVYGGVFLFAFGISFGMFSWREYKDKFKMNKMTLFIILSLVMSGLANYVSDGTWMNFILGFGACLAIFTIFSRVDYKKVEKSLLQFIKSIYYCILLPSLFLIIAYMGRIDTDRTFMEVTTSSLIKAGDICTNAVIKVVETIYNLGKYEYSGMLLLVAFIFLIFFALYDYFKKVKPIFYEEKGKRKEID